MVFERKIRIDNRDYYLGIELKYVKNKFLVKIDGSSFDMGDMSIMIDLVQNNYEKESKKTIYDNENFSMNNVLYLYDRFPFVCYIKESLYGNNAFITMETDEIINYIKTYNIKMNQWDRSECICPLLYE